MPDYRDQSDGNEVTVAINSDQKMLLVFVLPMQWTWHTMHTFWLACDILDTIKSVTQFRQRESFRPDDMPLVRQNQPR
jgi:hypothetical protein